MLGDAIFFIERAETEMGESFSKLANITADLFAGIE